MQSPATYVIRRSRAAKPQLPIVISAPHVGTYIPPDIAGRIEPRVLAELEDTDWCVHELYGFCTEMGITMIHAVYSRMVVDLNRPSEGPALYTDSRHQTDVVPATDFSGASIYLPGEAVSAGERSERLARYYEPYHSALREELAALRRSFDQVLLFDAHSIRRSVPTIAAQPFPDMILGDREGTSAAPALSAAVLESIRASDFGLSHNQPFKGGQITRSFGRPSEGVHALQLEMSQDIYLDGKGRCLDAEKVKRLRPVLQAAFVALAGVLERGI